MGIVYIKATIRNLRDERKKAESEFLVDTGAQYILADGEVVKRKLADAYIQIDGREGSTTVILGEKKDSALLGTITLEQMGLIVDPFSRELRPIKAMLV